MTEGEGWMLRMAWASPLWPKPSDPLSNNSAGVLYAMEVSMLSNAIAVAIGARHMRSYHEQADDAPNRG